MNTAPKTEPKIACACGPVTVIVCDVILHASIRVNCGFLRHDRPAKARIKFSSVFTVCISKRVIDVLLWSVDTESFGGNFKLLSRIPICKEGENPNENPDCLSIYTLQTAHVDGL